MKTLLKKDGFSFITMLGIISLVMIIVTSVFVYVVNSAMLVETGITNEVEYYDSYNKVDAALSIIVREENTDPSFLQGIESYLGVSINDVGNGVYEISDQYGQSKEVVSYFSASTGSGGGGSEEELLPTYDSFLQYMGTESGFSLNSMINTESMLSNYIVDLKNDQFPLASAPDPYATFSDSMSYFQYLVTQGYFVSRTPAQLTGQPNPTVDGFWYIDGDVTIADKYDLTIEDGYILVVNGNLTIGQRSVLSGTMIVNGDVTIDGSSRRYETVEATIYCSGSFLADADLYLGSRSRPTFIFAMQNISIGSNTDNYGYFLSNNFILNGTYSIDIIGGIYATNSAQYPSGLTDNPYLTSTSLPDYMITRNITYIPLSGLFTYDSVFQYTGMESGFTLNPLITPETMLSSYIIDMRNTEFPSASAPDPYASFSETISYIQVLVTQGYFISKTPSDLTNQSAPTVDGFWYINGDVTIPDKRNLTIEDGFVLVINGNFTMGSRSTYTGTVIVNGNVTIDGASNKYETVEGTIYCSGSFLSDADLNLGSSNRPTFIFAMQNITIDSRTRYYGYFMSNNFYLNGTSSIAITGGVYVMNSAEYPYSIAANTTLVSTDLPEYMVTETIASGSEEGSIIYTLPRTK